MKTKNELYDKLTTLQWLLHKQQVKIWAVNGPMADSSRGQGRILAMLKIKDNISTKELSFLLGIRVSSLNEMLAKMEKNGFVTREQSEEDKRVMLVKITDLGREQKQVEPADMSKIFDGLSPAEQAMFSEYLDRITEKILASEGSTKEEFNKKMEALVGKAGELGAELGRKGGDFADHFRESFETFFNAKDDDVTDVEFEEEDVEVAEDVAEEVKEEGEDVAPE